VDLIPGLVVLKPNSILSVRWTGTFVDAERHLQVRARTRCPDEPAETLDDAHLVGFDVVVAGQKNQAGRRRLEATAGPTASCGRAAGSSHRGRHRCRWAPCSSYPLP